MCSSIELNLVNIACEQNGLEMTDHHSSAHGLVQNESWDSAGGGGIRMNGPSNLGRRTTSLDNIVLGLRNG